MARVWFGTSGFSYPEWRGIFYPEGMAPDEFLAFYARHFNCVEVDRTFYRMPNVKTLESWRASTPDGFRFALKASQKITHFERLKLPSDSHDYLQGVLPELGDRLGVLLYQLPPTSKLNMERFEAFLANLSPSIPAAFEFRHESWFVDEVFDLMRRRKAGLCITDEGDTTTPLEVTGPLTYVRLRRDFYEPDEREVWRERFRGWVEQGVEVYAFLKHEENPDAPTLARAFAAGLPG